MGRFIVTILSLGILVALFNFSSGLLDGWLANMRLSGSSASAQAPATASASGSVVATPATSSATTSVAVTPASGSATPSIAVVPATGSATSSVVVATDPIFAEADAIIGAGTNSAIIAMPMDDEFDGDVYNVVSNDYLVGVGWSRVQLTPTSKDEFSARAARSASAAIEGILQVGGAVVDSTRQDLPALTGTVTVEQGLDPVAPKRMTGYLASLPESGPQFAAVFDFDCNGNAEACSQAIAVRVLEVFERQMAMQSDTENSRLADFGLRDVVFTNTTNPGYWKTAVFQGILLSGGRRSARAPLGRGEIYLTTSLVANDPRQVEGYLRVTGRPTLSFRVAECAGWGPCGDEIGKLVAYRLAVILEVAGLLPDESGTPQPHGQP